LAYLSLDPAGPIIVGRSLPHVENGRFEAMIS
jgi:hypothetical protein